MFSSILCDFPWLFPDFPSLFKIPWLFPDWKMPSHFSRFSSLSGNPARGCGDQRDRVDKGSRFGRGLRGLGMWEWCEVYLFYVLQKCKMMTTSKSLKDLVHLLMPATSNVKPVDTTRNVKNPILLWNEGAVLKASTADTWLASDKADWPGQNLFWVT